jgi:hypothetical protein
MSAENVAARPASAPSYTFPCLGPSGRGRSELTGPEPPLRQHPPGCCYARDFPADMDPPKLGARSALQPGCGEPVGGDVMGGRAGRRTIEGQRPTPFSHPSTAGEATRRASPPDMANGTHGCGCEARGGADSASRPFAMATDPAPFPQAVSPPVQPGTPARRPLVPALPSRRSTAVPVPVTSGSAERVSSGARVAIARPPDVSRTYGAAPCSRLFHTHTHRPSPRSSGRGRGRRGMGPRACRRGSAIA